MQYSNSYRVSCDSDHRHRPFSPAAVTRRSVQWRLSCYSIN